MYRIRLINLPFAALQFPSLALTQLKAVVRSDQGDRVDVEILYANHDFGRLAGFERYQEIATSVRHGTTGLGDWLFRQAAFPDQDDNSREYFARCYPTRDPATRRLRDAVLTLRDQIDSWLDRLIDRHDLDQANLVGMTSMFAQNGACLALARKLKQRNPAILTVMGGANCEFPMGFELVQHAPAVDFVFSGPGLKSLSQFLRYQLDSQPELCHHIDGVFSLRNVPADPGSVISLGNAAKSTERPAVGIFGHELNVNEPIGLDYDDYLESIAPWSEIQPTLLFETSRGCWWGERAHCTFCGLNGLTMKYRAMSPRQALGQFEQLFRIGAKLPRVTLQCVDNIMPKEYLQEVLPQLRTPPHVDIFYEVKSDLTERDVAVLAAARVRSIQPGIESLATSTLKLMKKGSTSFQGIGLLKNCLRHGIVPEWNLLMGFPGETWEVYEKYQHDLPRLYHLPPPTGSFPVRFDRYSPYFSEAEKYGLELRPYDFYALVYPFPPESLRRLAYFFIDDNFKADYFVQMVEWLGPINEEVTRWRRRFEGQDGSEPARLSLIHVDGRHVVADTRHGPRREHPINATSLDILQALEFPLDKSRLNAAMEPPGRARLDRELDHLYERGLLFEENGRFLSLVML